MRLFYFGFVSVISNQTGVRIILNKSRPLHKYCLAKNNALYILDYLCMRP